MPRGIETKLPGAERDVAPVHLKGPFARDHVVGHFGIVVEALGLILIELDESAAGIAAAGHQRVAPRLVVGIRSRSISSTIDRLRGSPAGPTRRRRGGRVLGAGAAAAAVPAAAGRGSASRRRWPLPGADDHFLLEPHDALAAEADAIGAGLHAGKLTCPLLLVSPLRSDAPITSTWTPRVRCPCGLVTVNAIPARRAGRRAAGAGAGGPGAVRPVPARARLGAGAGACACAKVTVPRRSRTEAMMLASREYNSHWPPGVSHWD